MSIASRIPWQDGFDAATAQDLDSFRGKVLQMNRDGRPASGNPFFNSSDGISARDYVFAYGFRNPFGGAWRAADNAHYAVENGPDVDRLAKVVSGRNYLWDGTDASMRNFALYNWDPDHAPVNIAFTEPETAFGSGFPAEKMGHAFVTESGPTYATGPQEDGKRIVEFVPDKRGERVSGPFPLVEYTGIGKATAVGLAAGTDGLYFTDLYKDVNYSSPIDQGANLLRVRYAKRLALDLKAKNQTLNKKLTFLATASADSTLVARGKAIKKKTQELAANEKAKVKAKLKQAKRKRLANKLDKKGKAKTKIRATATDQSGATATDKVKVKLKD
jgi:Glucose / Sorbosone dehydrogenase